MKSRTLFCMVALALVAALDLDAAPAAAQAPLEVYAIVDDTTGDVLNTVVIAAGDGSTVKPGTSHIKTKTASRGDKWDKVGGKVIHTPTPDEILNQAKGGN